ncbi:MAG: hypothetical protein ACQEXJ_13435 [Myxococcota bacterium]
MVFELAVYGVTIPLIVALVAMLAGTRPWSADGPSGRIAGAVAVAGAYAAAFLGARGWPDLPAVEATDWTFWAALVALALALLEVAADKVWVRWPLRAALVLGALWLVLRPMLEHTWEGTEGPLHVVGLAAGVLIVWALVEALARRRTGASIPLVLAAVACTGAGVVAIAASVVTAQLVVALAVAAGVPVLVAWWRGHVAMRGALAVFAPLLGLLWTVSWVYAGVDGRAMLLISAAPLLAWLGEIPAIRDRAAWLAVAVRVTLVVLPVAGALVVSEFLEEPAADYGEAPTEDAGDAEADDDGTYVPY